MTRGKQQHVLTLIRSKPACQGISASPALVRTHPLHKWILPNDNPQRFSCQDAVSPQEQRVTDIPTEQRVTEVMPLQSITNVPPIMAAPNPTKKRTLKNTKHTHLRLTRNNIPSSAPAISRAVPSHPILMTPAKHMQQSPHHSTPVNEISWRVPKVQLVPIPGGLQQSNLVS